MTDVDPNVSRPGDDDDSLLPADQTAYEREMEVEDEAPRRAASARFIVDAQIGSDAAMRDAMDPANQSLGDALRLSFRVLQAVILVLLVLFLASGFTTVDEGKSGVATVWGNIVSRDGQQALAPGAHFSVFPYPIGDFVIFDVENRQVDLGTAFSPAVRGQTQEQMLERAEVSNPLLPGRDGSLLTNGGDLAHMELSAKYIIDQPVEFVKQVNDDDGSRNANKLVQLALQHAAIQVVAGVSLQDLINPNQVEEIRQKLEKGAQESLDGLKCGIRISSVHVQRSYAPLAIEKSLGDQQAAKVEAAETIEKARDAYSNALTSVAGVRYAELIDLIERYEDALDRDDESNADQSLEAINAFLEGGDIAGEASSIIQYARSYQSEVERTLGLEYRRFQSLLEAYQQDPRLVVTQQWFDAFTHVISRPDTEVIYVDPLMAIRLYLSGSADIQELRRKNEIDRRATEAAMKNFDAQGHILRRSDVKEHDKAYRRFNVEDGKLNAPNANR